MSVYITAYDWLVFGGLFGLLAAFVVSFGIVR